MSGMKLTTTDHWKLQLGYAIDNCIIAASIEGGGYRITINEKNEGDTKVRSSVMVASPADKVALWQFLTAVTRKLEADMKEAGSGDPI